MRNINIIYMY